MPNRSSLVRRLAELHRIYTGETDSSLLPVITQSAGGLSLADRVWLLDALGGCQDTPMPPAVGPAVLPDATSTQQQRLEAGILYAAAHANHGPVFRMVRPQLDELWLHVHGDALTPLLAVVLPRVTVDGPVGLPGVRIRRHRRHIELYLLDSTTRVLLAAVSEARQSESLTALGLYGEESVWRNWRQPHPLTDAELAATSTGHLTAAIGSALLRRVCLFPTVPRVLHSPHAPGVCGVDWPEGRSTREVAAALTHPVAGLPGVVASGCSITNRHITVTTSGNSSSVVLSGPELPTLDLAPSRRLLSRLQAS
jgi:hypothetical protein